MGGSIMSDKVIETIYYILLLLCMICGTWAIHSMYAH